jgi:para-aminobenzoate synthetase component 1
MRLADTVAAALLAGLPGDAGAAVCRRGHDTLVGVDPDEVVVGNGSDALSRLDRLTPGLWVGWCAFEIGHALERVVPRSASLDEPSVPDAVFARFGAVATVRADGSVTVKGEGNGRRLLVDAAARSSRAAAADCRDRARPASGAWRTSLDRDDFEARVEAILELLRAGECYQVNLTRRLTVDEGLDPVGLYTSLAARHAAPHTGLLRLSVRGKPVAVVSASPERFLSWRDRRVETRPIKGTDVDADRLRRSVKDHAENVMIVDLARNDLGRVCEPGSVSVPSLCAVEAHPGLHHLVSTVLGTLRPEIGLSSLLAATLPPASVTGAPKPRVLQAIEELEPVRRGVYCGAFGWIDTERREGDLAVAIRTFTVFPDRTELGVGAGIVADSSPSREWAETELKASRLLAIAGAGALVPS